MSLYASRYNAEPTEFSQVFHSVSSQEYKYCYVIRVVCRNLSYCEHMCVGIVEEKCRTKKNW